jgi:DNA-binding response OmpR family regulator
MDPKQKILIIDDDPIYIESTRAILESRGYQVDSASNGKEGLAKMNQEKPHLVLLDVMMDWALDGIDVTQEMAGQWSLWGIPIIVVSSIRTSEYRGIFPRDQYLHINGWLDKPCPPDKLIAEIEATLAGCAKV